MAEILAPGSIISMTSQAADRLLKQDSGDAALLYLHILRHGSNPGPNWPQTRLDAALEALKSLGMAPEEAPVSSQPEPEPLPPEYTREDIAVALSDTASSFSALCDEAERLLGKKLTSIDLKELYTLYDFKALPAEVIVLLIGWCMEETERKQGKGQKPRLSTIRSEGFRWARQGVDTIERADAHIRRLTQLRTREAEIMRLLNLPQRPLSQREKDYFASWDEMGFDNDCIRTAFDLTLERKNNINWPYMNGILMAWHKKGLHTIAAVRVGDKDFKNWFASKGFNRGGSARPAQTPVDSAQDSERAREDMERAMRLLKQFDDGEG